MRYINVTQEDIDQGRPGDGRRCAIARAVLREQSEFSKSVDKEIAARINVSVAPLSFTDMSGVGVSVGTAGYFVIDGVKYHLPKRAREFVYKYDKFKSAAVSPISFALRKYGE